MKIILVGEIHSSKNSRRIFRNKRTGAPFVAKSRQSKEDEGVLSVQLVEQRQVWFQMTDGHAYPLHIEFAFRRATKRRFDYVNIAQGVLDAMVKAGYLPDDNMNYIIPHFAPYIIDKQRPGCEIQILPLGEHHE